MTSDSAFDLAPVGLAELTLDGRFMRCNARLSAMLGLSGDALLEHTLLDFTFVGEAAKAQVCLADLRAGAARSCAWDQRMRHADGTARWTHIALSMVPGADAAPARFIGSFIDASDRIESEQRRSVQHAVSHALAESDRAQDAIPRVLEELGTRLGWRFAAYWTMDALEQSLHAINVWSDEGAMLEQFTQVTRSTRLAAGRGLPGRTWSAGEARWSTDVVHDADFPRHDAAAAAGLHSAFAFPVRADGVMLGVIEVLGSAAQPPNESLLATVNGVGHQVGQFLSRRQLADAERDARARNTAMLESALDCVVIIDHHGCILEFNQAAERTFGHRRADVLGVPIADVIVPPALRDAHRAGMARYLATGEAHVLGKRLELPAMHADGSEFPVELAITRVPLPGDAVFTAYLRDVTDRKARETRDKLLVDASQLLGSSLDYQKTLRSLTEIVVPALADWYAVDLLENDVLRRLVVAHRDPEKVRLAEDLERRYPTDLAAPNGAPNVIRTGQTEYAAQIDPALLSASARDAEHLALIQGLGLTSYMVVPMRTSEGIVGTITFVTAESDRHYDANDVILAEELARRAGHAIENARLYSRVEEAVALLEQQSVQMEEQASELEASKEELEQSNEELEQANEELRETNDALEIRTKEAQSANLAKSEFLASMSHELRTPLNAVFGYVQLMADGIRGPVTEAQLSDLDRIKRSSQHLLGLINDILNFAKLESGHVRYQLSDVPANAILAGVGDLVGPQLRGRQIRYSYEPGDNQVTVRADPDKIVQVMLNLLSNAIKFTEPGGAVRVSWTATESDVRIMVADSGRGIAAAEIESIFEPFVQVGRERGQLAHGTGLGLAISRELARAMEGDLTVDSELGKGSTFIFRLPR